MKICPDFDPWDSKKYSVTFELSPPLLVNADVVSAQAANE